VMWKEGVERVGHLSVICHSSISHLSVITHLKGMIMEYSGLRDTGSETLSERQSVSGKELFRRRSG